MFNWFKKKDDLPKKRFEQIAQAFSGLESGLKGVESHWIVGNKKQGDELFEAIFEMCVKAFVEHIDHRKEIQQIAGQGINIRELQFEGLKMLIRFLQKHGLRSETNLVAKRLKAHVNEFTQSQREFIIRALDVHMESADPSSHDTRLIYYVCQSCGQLNLVFTLPCLYCGFSCKSQASVRRAILLSSAILTTPMLLSLSIDLTIRRDEDPNATIEQVWNLGDFDKEAFERTQVLNNRIAQFVDDSTRTADDFIELPSVQVSCPKCGQIQNILTASMIQRCFSCQAVVPIPHLRRIKATILVMLGAIVYSADHKDELRYANFIATLVFLADYALRRDAVPTKMQAIDLLTHFSSIESLSYFGGKAYVQIVHGRAVGFRVAGTVLNEDVEANFYQHVKAINLFFENLQSDKLPA